MHMYHNACLVSFLFSLKKNLSVFCELIFKQDTKLEWTKKNLLMGSFSLGYNREHYHHQSAVEGRDSLSWEEMIFCKSSSGLDSKENHKSYVNVRITDTDMISFIHLYNSYLN